MIEEADTEAPGWAAIDAALRPLYGELEPRHYGAVIPWQLGGDNPLQGISAYRRDDPVPHWHFVTYGFSDLYEKEHRSSARSGYGFELTFRLAGDNAVEPPAWALGLLQNLARYVFESGNVFEHGHYLNLNGPIALGHDTAIRSIAFVRDPELSPTDTVNGRLEFLQVVGLTLDEEGVLKRWSAAGLFALIAEAVPAFVTNLARTSALNDRALATRASEGIARDGSSTASLFVGPIGWTRRKRLLRADAMEVRIGAGQVADLVALLPLRLHHGRTLSVFGSEARVDFLAAARSSLVESGHLEMHLDASAVREIAATLAPRVGSYPIRTVPGLSFRVLPTEIRDSNGQIVDTIG